MTLKRVFLKPRGAAELVPWEEIAVDAPELSPQTRLEEAQFVAIDVETTGNAPFLVLELGAERFKLSGPLSFFDTLVDCRAPITPSARCGSARLSSGTHAEHSCASPRVLFSSSTATTRSTPGWWAAGSKA